MTRQQSSSCLFQILSPAQFCSSKHEGSPDSDSKHIVKPKKNEESIKKLNLLLKQMAEVS